MDTSPIKSKNKCELFDVKITENLFPISRSDSSLFYGKLLFPDCSFGAPPLDQSVPLTDLKLLLFIIHISGSSFEGFNFHQMVASVFIFIRYRDLPFNNPTVR